MLGGALGRVLRAPVPHTVDASVSVSVSSSRAWMALSSSASSSSHSVAPSTLARNRANSSRLARHFVRKSSSGAAAGDRRSIVSKPEAAIASKCDLEGDTLELRHQPRLGVGDERPQES